MVSSTAKTTRKELQYNSKVFKESEISAEEAQRSLKECEAFESHAEKWRNENAFAMAGIKNEEAAFMCKAVALRAAQPDFAASFMDLYAKHSARAAQFYDLAAHELISDQDTFKSEGSPYPTGSITSRFYSAGNYLSMASKCYADAGDDAASKKYGALSKLWKAKGTRAQMESMPLWKFLRYEISKETAPDAVTAMNAIRAMLSKKLDSLMRIEGAENGDQER